MDLKCKSIILILDIYLIQDIADCLFKKDLKLNTVLCVTLVCLVGTSNSSRTPRDPFQRGRWAGKHSANKGIGADQGQSNNEQT